MVALSQSAYPWWSFQAFREAGFWLTLCCSNVRWEPRALQLAACCTLWRWGLTSDKSSWKLGKVLELEAVSRCVTKATKSLWIESAPAEGDTVLPCCFGGIICTWTQILLLKVTRDPAVHPAPSYPHVVTCQDMWCPLVGVTSPSHQWPPIYWIKLSKSSSWRACYLSTLLREFRFGSRLACLGWG